MSARASAWRKFEGFGASPPLVVPFDVSLPLSLANGFYVPPSRHDMNKRYAVSRVICNNIVIFTHEKPVPLQINTLPYVLAV